MAQLEIRRDGRVAAVVDLGEEPLSVGFDRQGAPAWGEERVERQVCVVEGSVLRSGDGDRRLSPGEMVEIDGLELTYRRDADVRAAAVNDIGRLLWTFASVEEIFDQVLDSLGRVLRARRAAIALFDDDDVLAVVAVHGESPTLNPTLTRAVIDSGAAILTSEAAVEEGTNEISIDVRSILCAPLRHEGEAQGVIYVDNHGRPTSFTNDELDFASALAHLTSFALANLTLREENVRLKRRLGDRVVLSSNAMQDIQAKLEKVAGFDATVLITGESGVGKEMVALEIHRLSPRRDGPFVAVNCAAIPDTLLESELFGYAPQSGISGADPKGRAGKFEQAGGGTIFLDEIGEMKPELQVKLLRILEDKKVDRLNDTVSRDIDIRILVATNQNLEQLVKTGGFREDLYYRLNVVGIEVPPLRERPEDVLTLADLFVRVYPEPGLREAKISRAAARALEAHHWPGNVRELKNCIEQALILGDGKTIRLSDLTPPVRAATGGDALPPLSEIEKEHIARVLAATKWNKAKSSRILGISKPTLYDKIRNYGLTQE